MPTKSPELRQRCDPRRKSVHFGVRIALPEAARVMALAARRDMPAADVLREAVACYLATVPPEATDA